MKASFKFRLRNGKGKYLKPLLQVQAKRVVVCLVIDKLAKPAGDPVEKKRKRIRKSAH